MIRNRAIFQDVECPVSSKKVTSYMAIATKRMNAKRSLEIVKGLVHNNRIPQWVIRLHIKESDSSWDEWVQYTYWPKSSKQSRKDTLQDITNDLNLFKTHAATIVTVEEISEVIDFISQDAGFSGSYLVKF